MLEIPERFKNVKYVSSRVPGCKDQENLQLGANCEVFVYAILKYFGKNVPDYRSSELWSDEKYTKKVDKPKPLDIMLYNNKLDSYGAHVGLYLGKGEVYHLSKENGIPKIEKHKDLVKQSKYSYFIGAKRVIS